MEKKAQMHMTETVAVLFIFFILIALGIVFYYQYSQVALKQEQEKLLATRAMDTTLKALFLPELMCTRGEAEPEDNCIDLSKARAAKIIFGQELNDYYYALFSYAKITLNQTYPLPLELVLYDKEKTKTLEDGTVVKAWERKEPTYFVVALRDEITTEGQPQYGFGYLKVEVYS